ncbi:MAG TPA: VOC family protein [Bacteroidia bacterium]|nr:VOC family protein [Bacteroidia bacterium]
MTIQKLTPNLWFDKNAQEAVDFYLAVFRDSGIDRITHYGKAGFEVHKMPEGTVLTIEFHIEGHQFVALNGGPVFQFNEAISFIVNCDTQEEIDYYWDRLTEDGPVKSQQCGWLKDKFGVSWQIVPTALSEMLEDSNQEKAADVMTAMLRMKKLDIEKLRRAYEGDMIEAV